MRMGPVKSVEIVAKKVNLFGLPINTKFHVLCQGWDGTICGDSDGKLCVWVDVRGYSKKIRITSENNKTLDVKFTANRTLMVEFLRDFGNNMCVGDIVTIKPMGYMDGEPMFLIDNAGFCRWRDFCDFCQLVPLQPRQSHMPDPLLRE